MLRSAYLRLAAPAKQGAKALGEFKDKMHLTAEEMPDVAKEALLAQSRLQGLGVKIFNKGKMRSMIDILRDLHKATKNLSDDKRLGAVKDIFGTYATSGALNIFKAFDKKPDETGSVDQVLDKIKNSAGTAKNIADRLNDTAVGSLRELDSSVESLGISFGNTLLPIISSSARGVANFALKIGNLAEEFPVTTKYIGMTITGLIGLKIATVALGYSFTFVKGAVLTARGVFIAFRTTLTLFGLVLPMITTAIRVMGLALLTNPITWIVGAIAVSAFLLIKYWKPIGAFFTNIFSGIVGWAQRTFEWVSKLINPLKSVVSAASNLAGKAWNFVTGDSKSQNQTSASAPSTVGDIVSEFTKTNQNISKIPSFEMPNVSSAGGDNSGSQISISAPITINTSGNMDEKKIADQVRITIDETFRKLSARRMALNYD